MKQLNSIVLGIDQSLNGTGLCLLRDSRPVLLETITLTRDEGDLARLEAITSRVAAILDEHQPSIVAMEDYAAQARSASLIPLVELGGCIKWVIFRRGYREGREAVLIGDRIFRVQNQSQMKKMMLGHGGVSKDERYLLTVCERVHQSFADSNQADAYMHACMARLCVAVARGAVGIDALPSYQQEALISNGARSRKGLSLVKAMKLPSDEKMKLVGF